MQKALSQSFETTNLLMRPLSFLDLDDFACLYGDPEVMQYIGSGAVSQSKAKTIIETAVNNWNNYSFGPWALILKNNNKFIGRGGLYYLDNTSDIQLGCALAKQYWGQGLAKEAAIASLWYGFDRLDLQYIYAKIRVDNARSRKLAEQLSMKFYRNAKECNHHDVIYQLDKLTFLKSFSCPIINI